MAEHLLLKWGTLKDWNVESEAGLEALRRFFADGVSASAMAQRNTEAQKQAICDLIDVIDGEIANDWSGETMTREEAKRYVMEYRDGRK